MCRFACPYHGWTYALDGRLTKATRLRGIKDFRAKDFGLKPIQVAEWGPLVFVRLADDVGQDDLASSLRDVDFEFRKRPFSPGLTWVRRVAYDMKCNWKVFVDNYLDGGYHVEHLHSDLTATLKIDSYETHVGDCFSTQKVRGAGNDARVGDDMALYTFVFPNLMLNRYGPWLDTNVILPTGETV